jgi:hypothetical protein
MRIQPRRERCASCSRCEVAQHIAIALAVLKPPIQIGHGRKLPNQSDRDRDVKPQDAADRRNE